MCIKYFALSGPKKVLSKCHLFGLISKHLIPVTELDHFLKIHIYIYTTYTYDIYIFIYDAMHN